MPAQSSTSGQGSRSVSPKGYEKVVSYLSDQLRDGLLKTGDRLLPERELALRLNISRPLVREALRSLAMIGVLDVHQGRGTFVRSPDFSTLENIFTFMFVQGGEEIDDIMELRQGIELQAIRLACLRASDDDFEKIGAALENIHATIHDPIAGGRADFHFHTCLVEASHSAALIKVYRIVSRSLQNNHVRRRRRVAVSGHLLAYIIDHHERLFRSVQSRDVDASEKLLREHFRIGEKLNSEEPGELRPP